MLKAVNIIGTWKFQALWFVATIAVLTVLEYNRPGSAFLYAPIAGVVGMGWSLLGAYMAIRKRVQ